MARQTTKWTYIRILIVSIGLYGGSKVDMWDFPEPWFFSVIMLVVIPLAVLLVTAMNAKRLPPMWHPPRWDLNPFTLNEPFQFFHLIAWIEIVGGLTGCLLLPWVGFSFAGQAVSHIVFGISILLGIRLSMRVFYNRIVQAD